MERQNAQETKDTRSYKQVARDAREPGTLAESVDKIPHTEKDVRTAKGADIEPHLWDDRTNTVLLEMLHRVAGSDAHFKHQQRGEPDLSHEEKFKIASAVYQTNRVTFLSRFGKHLVQEDLNLFEPFKGEYEVAYYLNEIRRRLNDRSNGMKIRNRRFEAMKKMTLEGDYFTEDSMKSRDPLLYEQMVGQYLTDEQVHHRVEDKDLGFASVLLEHVQTLQDNELYDKLKDAEDGQVEEDESEDEEMDITVKEPSEVSISALDQQMLRNEFLRTMQLRFLNGDDTQHFDYRDVDENVEYDSLDIREHDEEEKYFDEDDTNESDSQQDGPTHARGLTPAESGSPYNDRVPYNGVICSDASSDDIDYEQYEVKDDIRPGLLDITSDTGREENTENTTKTTGDIGKENG